MEERIKEIEEGLDRLWLTFFVVIVLISLALLLMSIYFYKNLMFGC